MTTTRRKFCVLLAASTASAASFGKRMRGFSDGGHPSPATGLEELFHSPPDKARPYVLWMWMGSNVSESGITSDLEAMKEAGFGGATIYGLSDTVIPWACEILKSPTPDIVAYTEPWWRLVRHAAIECHRLGLELILHNCAGYESSGGTWITPELSMQEVVWSKQEVHGGSTYKGNLPRPRVDPHPHAQFPEVYIPALGKVGIPEVAARNAYFRDIAVLALPAEGAASKNQIVNLTDRMDTEGNIEWQAPEGSWAIYRFGHTTTGAMIQPAQFRAMGLECDKMNRAAVTFHIEHVLGLIEKYLGDLRGAGLGSGAAGLTTLYFDSYEAGDPTWTPKMAEEFERRRGYSILPWLPVLAGRTIGSSAETDKFKADFKRTVEDLYRDEYWATPRPLAHAAGLKFNAEPYQGPWVISEVVQSLDTPTVEFWTTNGVYSPSSLDPVVEAAHHFGDQLIAAEAFTTAPEWAAWKAHPAWLKPIGDAAFCAGVNRFNLHHFVQQPWDEKYRPGNAMGQWGIHFGRLQTWWKPGKAWVDYLWRCQALLQCGKFMEPSHATSLSSQVLTGQPALQSIHRRDAEGDIYFVANTAWAEGRAKLVFPVKGRQPELWDPVQGTTRDQTSCTQEAGGISFELEFAPTQSFFVVFRKALVTTSKQRSKLPSFATVLEMEGSWQVAFDSRWGGPASDLIFDKLTDWSKSNHAGIKYFSGTAVYRKTLSVSEELIGTPLYLDLGVVKHLAAVTVNGNDLGVVWTAPWRIDIRKAVRTGENKVEIAVTNVWANRLIGDEQEPADLIWEIGDPKFHSGRFLKEFPDWFLKNESRPSSGRYTFTTWNYFTKDSPLESSGLLGPVRLVKEIEMN